jgi:hypothetical protein
MTHGMFNYDPKFFWHLCRENEYEIMSLGVSEDGSGAVPESVLANNLKFTGRNAIFSAAVPDFMIRATLLKKNDRPFVTPLDLPPNIKTERPVGFLGRALKRLVARYTEPTESQWRSR